MPARHRLNSQEPAIGDTYAAVADYDIHSNVGKTLFRQFNKGALYMHIMKGDHTRWCRLLVYVSQPQHSKYDPNQIYIVQAAANGNKYFKKWKKYVLENAVLAE